MYSFKTHYLEEARRNPDQNPKLSVYDQIEPYLNDPDVYISFVRHNKLGIYPSSKYQTPIGIYSYPLKESISAYNIRGIESKGLRFAFPFAADKADYFSLFRSRNPRKLLMLRDSEYTERDYVTDIKKLEEYYTKTARIPDYSFNEFVYKAEENTYNSQRRYAHIWNVTRCASANWNPTATKTDPSKWNYIFRKVLGYEGVVDIDGKSIIHPDEPTQAVFFSKEYVKEILRAENKTSGTSRISYRILPDDIKHEMISGTFYELIEMLKNHSWENYEKVEDTFIYHHNIDYDDMFGMVPSLSKYKTSLANFHTMEIEFKNLAKIFNLSIYPGKYLIFHYT